MRFREIKESHLSRLNRNNRISKSLWPRFEGMDQKDRMAIMNYTSTEGSRSLNNALINDHPLTDKQTETHNAIHRHCKPHVGDDLTLYSGTRHDFGEMARSSKDGIIHSPAHISTSHDLRVADNYMTASDHPVLHMLRIKVKANDKILHTSGHSYYETERETVIPSGTKLKYSHSSKHMSREEHTQKKPVMVHHFTIHSQD